MLIDKQTTLKESTRRAIELAGGSVAAAKHVRISQSHLSEYCSHSHPSFVPLDVAVELDRLAGDNIILRAWADLCGFDLSPREADVIAAKDAINIAGLVAKESGDVVSTSIAVLSAGQCTPRRAREIMGEVDEMIEAGVLLKRAITPLARAPG